MNAAFLYGLTYVFMFAAGYVWGKLSGYSDAQPKRDARGRFAKRD